MSSQLLNTPSTHCWSLAGVGDIFLHHVKELVVRFFWPLAWLAEYTVMLYVTIFIHPPMIGPRP
jgi:hypothetical protein